MKIQSVNDKGTKVMVWMSVRDLLRMSKATYFYIKNEREANNHEKECLRILQAKLIKVRDEL